MFLLKNLVSSISKVTQDLGNIISVNTNVTGGSSVDGHISTSGLLSDTLSTVTNTLTSTTTGLVSDVAGTVTGSIGSTSPVDTVTNIIGGVTGGISGGNPLEAVTNIIGGVTGGIGGGTSPISPVVEVVQGGIDILQGVESLKTEIINTGIDTVADTIIGALPQTEHPVSEIADLGTLTFETSRDTVNGTLEVISDLVGGDIQGATESATGVIETLITNGTTATGIVTEVVGSITDVVGGVTGGIGDGTSPIAPVIDVVQGGIDILQGVESLKTEIINTGIDTVADTIIGILPQTEYPVSDLADLGTLTFETSRDTVNGALEVVSDLVGGDIQGATESATGILGTLVTNGSTATGIVNNIIGGVTSGDSPLGVVTDIIGGVTGGVGGNPLEVITDIIGGVTGGVDGNPLEIITDIIGGVTGGVDGNPLEVITDIIGGVTGGVDGNPLEIITDIIGGVTGGVDGNPLEVITDIIGGITGGIGGGTSPISPVIDVVQGGIDILQGVESLKTEIINTGIDTVADTIISIIPQAEHPVSEIADLGTLTFETSRDTVNGALEVVSDLVGGDIQGATESATGILDTLITNGTTATGLVTEIIGGLTGTIGGVTGGDSSLDLVTDLLGGLTGSVTGGTDNPIGIVTDIVGSLTGGVTGEGGLDVISNLLGGLTGGSLLGGVTSTVSSVTNTTHTIVPTSLLTDNFLENSFNTV
ncbi:beta strand repeat-containing protein [Acinetobacter geminorum]